jgi:glycosyltransferase involved in cell wall biosynthesis
MNEPSMSAGPGKRQDGKRIVGVISFMNKAGAQSALLRLARALRARGHVVEIWALYEKSPYGNGEGPSVTFMAQPELSVLEYLKVYVRLLSRLWKTKPDAVVGFLPLGNIFGLSAAALCGVPRRVASQRSPGTTYGRVTRFLDRVMGASGIYHSIVCVSDSVRSAFSGYPSKYRDKLSVIHNGIDWTPSDVDAPSARRRLGLPLDGSLVAAVGRLEAQKNYPLLMEIASKVERAHFAIAGDGVLRPSLEALARFSGVAHRVSFLGGLDQTSVRRLLEAADVFIHTASFEGQSNAVLEAMHEGLPIIAGDIPAGRETLCDEEGNPAGVLVSLDDIDAWAGALSRLLDDPNCAGNIGGRAREMARKRFSLDRMADRFEQTLTS